MTRRSRALLAGAFTALALAACGGSDSNPPASPSPTQPATPTPETTVKPDMRCAP